MRRERIRSAYSPEELAKIYPRPHVHFGNQDHRLRVAVTIALAKALAGSVDSVADLSCGDAAIASAINAPRRILGDLAPGYPIEGPIESTVHQIPAVDLFVCTETVEHLDDPDTVLKSVREKTRMLVLSTPVDAWDDVQNEEHYWCWDREAVEDMVCMAGFQVCTYVELDLTYAGPYHYKFGTWGCR